ncbi:MAG TPA: protein kinase [Pyrinomonadaceae bacterium]|nr:protein kinase [Pyrinomonadaceae bacterium]
MTLAEGTKLGRYEIRSQLGAGGMGEVYLASDTKLQRSVALKILPAEVAVDRNRMNRFVQEAKAASALNHPNILTIYEIDHSDSLHFIASEFVDGQTLRQRMKRVRLSVRDVLDLAIQVGSALSAAHDAGILHRDIKPENIMLRRDGLVKVVDFGLAKLISQQESTSLDTEAPTSFRTNPGTVMGTTYYMSPEQARGLELDSRTDVFSLAVVIYEMLAGRLPFEGSKSAEVMAWLLNEREAQPLGRFTTEISTELERIISKALRKNRGERYQTIKDMVLDLKSLKEELDFERKLERSTPPKSEMAAGTGGPKPTTSSELRARPTISDRSFAVGKKPVIAAIVLLVSVGAAYLYFSRSAVRTIDSIAVLPFINASGNSELEYLSDGMTDSLINSLSQLPNLSVKARSSVFHYKGTEIDPQKLAADLSVQAILSGRVVQRGDDLTLYLSLVDGRNGNQLWGEQYNRKLTDIVSLQTEIAREVSRKLQTRLSGADEQRLTRRYPANPEAYQLYLKGRYYLIKGAESDLLTGISYFQKAIEIDPSYAIAYVGLADAYRSPSLEIRPTEGLPKAKAAALKAIELDDTLAEGHAVLGWVHFWYDWDWSSAESQFKRAMELDENNADAHSYRANLLSNIGRHAEALAEARRARELEPLNLRINALEGQFLVFAGQVDGGIDRLQKTLELDPNYYLARTFLAQGYIEKKMFPEAAAEARKAINVSPNSTYAKSLLAYALAKGGKTAEGRAVVEDLVRISNQRYVSGSSVANAFNGLGDRENALAWLERGFQEHDVRLIFLKVDPKWNNLRSEPRFQDLMRRVGLSP